MPVKVEVSEEDSANRAMDSISVLPLKVTRHNNNNDYYNSYHHYRCFDYVTFMISRHFS